MRIGVVLPIAHDDWLAAAPSYAEIREIARGLPHADDPNHLELLQTLALSHLCAQRLAAERQRWGAQRR